MRVLSGLPRLTFLAALLLLIGCDSSSNDDDSGGGPQELDLGTVIAEIDGEPFRSVVASASLTLDFSTYGDFLLLAAGQSGGTALAFALLPFEDEGSYELRATQSQFHNANVIVVDGSTQTTYLVGRVDLEYGEGQVQITAVDEESIRGTFAFTAYAEDDEDGSDPVRVTEGRFNVPLTEN